MTAFSFTSGTPKNVPSEKDSYDFGEGHPRNARYDYPHDESNNVKGTHCLLANTNREMGSVPSIAVSGFMV